MTSKTFNTATIARLLRHEDEHGMGHVFMYAFLNEVVRQKRPFPFDCESAQVSPNLIIVDNRGRSIAVEHRRNRLSLTLNDQRIETPSHIEYKGEAYHQIILAWLAACIRYTSLQPEFRKELTKYAKHIQRRFWLTKVLPVHYFSTIFLLSLQHKTNLMENQIVIYQTDNGQTAIDVRLENETVWLTQAQMAQLFQKDRTVIGRHIRNVYKEGELNEIGTCAKFAHMGHDGLQQYETIMYNLDVIISVGYRVKSQRGVQFRQWANKVLKDYLLKGYAVNEKIRQNQISELRQLVQMVGRTLQNQPLLKNEENQALFDIVVDYTYALDTLDDYDYQRLGVKETTQEEKFQATYDNAMQAITALREKFGGSSLFGNEKDDSFKSSIGQIYQTFGGEDLYPSVEEKAAMLLYLVTKNHSFSDGNKRIAATLFLWFLNNNGILYREDGSKRIADNTLVALTLMIAESKPEEKDVMVKVVVNLINQKN